MQTSNRARLLARLDAMAQIGRLATAAGGGLDRRPFSAAERAARGCFTEWAQAAGLQVAVDAAANLSARLPAPDPQARTLLLGSHLDTVPNGGPYDGALGVLAALETATVLAERGVSLPFHVEATAFTDEEGRFGDFFGSRAMAGLHTAQTVAAFMRRAGAHADDLAAMQAVAPGLPDAVSQAARAPESLVGYLELHIEQGPRLEAAGVPIGVVSAIFGRRSLRVIFHGRPDHAGTTPMDLRADALAAAAEFITRARDLVQDQFAEAVLTCGDVSVAPGVYNVVPGQATLLVEFRAAQEATLVEMSQAVEALAAAVAARPGLAVSMEPTSGHEPAAMDPTMQQAIRAAAARAGYPWRDLPSGAGHDAQILATITPAGMIFVPSLGGRSHCPDEMTAEDDLVAGADVLLGTVLTLAGVA